MSKVVELIHKAVLDYGWDWVDPHAASGDGQCQYVYMDGDTARQCIAGKAFVEAGVHVDDLESAVLFEGNVSADQMVWYLKGRGHDIDLSEAESAQLSFCQELQDNGIAWGTVLDLLQKLHHLINEPHDASTLAGPIVTAFKHGKATNDNV